MNTTQIDSHLTASIVRRIARYVAGGLATKGVIANSDQEFYVGLAVLLATEAWAFYRDRQARRASKDLHASEIPSEPSTAQDAREPKQ
jgi:hypothetical protein